MPATKIVVIGVGSASFGPAMLGDLLRCDRLRGSTVALCDINQHGLDMMVRLARRLNREWDAAMIDGCSRVGALFRVVMPLSALGLFATGIFTFLGAWNEFLLALVMTQSLTSKTMPVALAEFIGRFQVDYGLMCTVGVIACIPPILVALIFQRHLIEGLTAGAVKA